MEPKFEAFAASRNDNPETVIVWATPGVSRAIFSACASTSRVRRTEAESGSWIFMISRPWSWSGMNPVGARVKTQYVNTTSPPYARRIRMLILRSRPTALA